jgi:NTE family protein
LAGTSIGALVGAIYINKALPKLEELAQDISIDTLLSLVDVSFPGLGLIDGDRICEFLSGYLTDATIEDCDIPFRCVATNFLLKKEFVFQTGSLVNAVRASIAMPGVLTPFHHENIYLVDGGVVNPVPVSVLKAMGAKTVIAVNLNRDTKTASPDARPDGGSSKSTASSPPTEDQNPDESPSDSDPKQDSEAAGFAQGLVNRYDNLKTVLQDRLDDWMPDPATGINIFDVIGNSINMMEQQVTHITLQLDQPDVLIEPNLMEFGLFDFHQAQPIIQQGYEATKERMPQIQQCLSQPQD